MKEIILNDTDFSKAKMAAFDSREALFFEYQNNYLIKYFLDFTENKMKTLFYLDEYRSVLKQNFPFLIPEAIGVLNGNAKACIIEMGYPNKLASLNSQDSFDLKIILLKQIGVILETLESLRKNENILCDFFIGDLHDGNILIDKEKQLIQICDLDSCKIKDNLPFLVKYFSSLYPEHYLKHCLKQKYCYQNGFLVPNQESDLLCYIIIIFKVLFEVDICTFSIQEYYSYLEKLVRNQLPIPLYQMFQNIYSLEPTLNHYQYLDDLPVSLERKIKKHIL